MVRALAAITAVLALAAPQLAAAKPRPKPHQVADNVAWYAVDGSRYAAWGKDSPYHSAGPPGATERFTVLDTRTHKRRRMSRPEACSSANNDGRSMLDGWMLMPCDTTTGRYQGLLDLRTGRIHKLPAGDNYWVSLGKRWIEGLTAEYGARAYLNRRSGEIRRLPAPSDPDADPPVRNLDDPKLRAVCIDPGALYDRARFYDGKYVVSEPDDFPYPYLLHRSCDAKGEFLTGGGGDVTWPFVDAGWVTWGKGGGAHAMNLATGKRHSWHVPHYRDVGTPEVAQTNNTLFFAPPQTDDGTSAPAVTSYDLFTMPLPRPK
jgi:hypothetical protein